MRDFFDAFSSPDLTRYGYTVRLVGRCTVTSPPFSTTSSNALCKESFVVREKYGGLAAKEQRALSTSRRDVGSAAAGQCTKHLFRKSSATLCVFTVVAGPAASMSSATASLECVGAGKGKSS